MHRQAGNTRHHRYVGVVFGYVCTRMSALRPCAERTQRCKGSLRKTHWYSACRRKIWTHGCSLRRICAPVVNELREHEIDERFGIAHLRRKIAHRAVLRMAGKGMFWLFPKRARRRDPCYLTTGSVPDLRSLVLLPWTVPISHAIERRRNLFVAQGVHRAIVSEAKTTLARGNDDTRAYATKDPSLPLAGVRLTALAHNVVAFRPPAFSSFSTKRTICSAYYILIPGHQQRRQLPLQRAYNRHCGDTCPHTPQSSAAPHLTPTNMNDYN